MVILLAACDTSQSNSAYASDDKITKPSLTTSLVEQTSESPSTSSQVEPSGQPLSLPETTSPDVESASPQTPGLVNRLSFNEIFQLLGAGVFEVFDFSTDMDDWFYNPDACVGFYDGLHFYTDGNTQETIVCIAAAADECEYDGVALDKSREELFDLFGTPKSEWYDNEGSPYYYGLLMDYEIEGCFVRFCLSSSDEKPFAIQFFLSEPPQQYWTGFN